MFFLPFGHILGPLIVWLAKRDSSPEIDAHGKASLNFQLTMSLIYLCLGIIGVVLIAILIAAGAVEMFKTEHLDLMTANLIVTMIGLVLIAILSVIGAIYGWVMIAVNGIRAYDGKPAYYLPSISFLK